MKQGEKTEVFSTGKVDFVLYPEVYYLFVAELMKHHDDIMRAMVLAQVKIEDGTAIDFLNHFLGTKVDKTTPMEVGYASFLDALKMRVQNRAADIAIEKVAAQFKDHSLFPSRSDPSKPLFPDEADQ